MGLAFFDSGARSIYSSVRPVRSLADMKGLWRREKWRDLEDRSRKQAEAAGVNIVTDIDRKPFEEAMAGIYAKARDPAAAQLIERIRKVE